MKRMELVCRPTGPVGVIRDDGKRAACPTILLLFLASAAFAASVNSTIDGGGKRTTSTSYTIDGSVGGIGDISSAGADTVKDSYIGQLYDVASLSITGTPSAVNEGNTSQLSGTATLDDATLLALAGSDINWSVPGYPLSSINGSGLATASIVYSNAIGVVSGNYLGTVGSGSLLVLDSNPDNFGSYAGDGIPDWWQNQYFGTNNPNAGPNADADGTGQNNLFKYVAGLNPTNPASIFVLKIAGVSGQPTQKNLIFNPIAGGRTYTVESKTNLLSGSYAALVSFSGPVTNVNQATVTDLNATPSAEFYHVHISLP